MPYIKKERRSEALQSPLNAGELNYAITCLIDEYVKREGLKYRVINDALGALEGAKLEFYRRVVAPYENAKIVENGDVY